MTNRDLRSKCKATHIKVPNNQKRFPTDLNHGQTWTNVENRKESRKVASRTKSKPKRSNISTGTPNKTQKSSRKTQESRRRERTHHMYSAMILSVVSERSRLMRSVSRAMVAIQLLPTQSGARVGWGGGGGGGKTRGWNSFYRQARK